MYIIDFAWKMSLIRTEYQIKAEEQQLLKERQQVKTDLQKQVKD